MTCGNNEQCSNSESKKYYKTEAERRRKKNKLKQTKVIRVCPNSKLMCLSICVHVFLTFISIACVLVSNLFLSDLLTPDTSHNKIVIW